ncbi:hypothetical protein Tco_0366500 [Tanacetum coccineum]
MKYNGVQVMDNNNNEDDFDTIANGKKHKGKHDKPKPWDEIEVDSWEIDKLEPKDNVGGSLLEESSLYIINREMTAKEYEKVLDNKGKALVSVRVKFCSIYHEIKVTIIVRH